MDTQDPDHITNAEDGTEALVMPSDNVPSHPHKVVFRDTDADKVISVGYFKTQAIARATAANWANGIATPGQNAINI